MKRFLFFVLCLSFSFNVNGAAVDRAVVFIKTLQLGVVVYPDGQKTNQVANCTGTIISKNGLIVTASHCISNRASDDSIYVVINGVMTRAKIIADTITEYDFALLDIAGSFHRYMPLCASSRVGEEIYVVGMPSGIKEISEGRIVKKQLGDLRLSTKNTRKGFSGSPVVNKKKKCLSGVYWGRIISRKYGILTPSATSVETIREAVRLFAE